MFTAKPTTRQHYPASTPESSATTSMVKHGGLRSTIGSTAYCTEKTNVSPTFRLPDLISASVSLVFTHQTRRSEFSNSWEAS